MVDCAALVLVSQFVGACAPKEPLKANQAVVINAICMLDLNYGVLSSKSYTSISQGIFTVFHVPLLRDY